MSESNIPSFSESLNFLGLCIPFFFFFLLALTDASLGKQWRGGILGVQCLTVSCSSVSVLSMLSGCLIVWFIVIGWSVGLSVDTLVRALFHCSPRGLWWQMAMRCSCGGISDVGFRPVSDQNWMWCKDSDVEFCLADVLILYGQCRYSDAVVLPGMRSVYKKCYMWYKDSDVESCLASVLYFYGQIRCSDAVVSPGVRSAYVSELLFFAILKNRLWHSVTKMAKMTYTLTNWQDVNNICADVVAS